MGANQRYVRWALVGTVCAALWCLAQVSLAGTITVKYNPPADSDLKECRFFAQNAAGGAVDNKIVLAADLGPGKTVVFNYDSALIQSGTGKAVARCVDVAGQVSVDSLPLVFTFPDRVPAAPELTDVQVKP